MKKNINGTTELQAKVRVTEVSIVFSLQDTHGNNGPESRHKS